MPKLIRVRKANEELEVFDESKVLASLEWADISKDEAGGLLAHVKENLYDGISTKEIYDYIYEHLNKYNPHLASRYSLKKAIMELGPSGFPFEKFIARVLRHYGYKVRLNQNIKGKCVVHEVDIASEKERVKSMIECKFRKNPGSRSDIKVALYVYARFLDLKPKFFQPWLITNTKCTTDAYNYGKCVGLKITSWEYPKDASLSLLIEESGLHPVTVISGLSNFKKKSLLDEGLVLCRDIYADEDSRASKILGKDYEKVKVQSKKICRI